MVALVMKLGAILSFTTWAEALIWGIRQHPCTRLLPTLMSELGQAELVATPLLPQPPANAELSALAFAPVAEAESTMEAMRRCELRPLTPGFLELALAGSWRFVRANTAAVRGMRGDGLPVEGDVEVLEATLALQTTSPGYGEQLASVRWAAGDVAGTLRVGASFIVDEFGRLQAERSSTELDVDVDVSESLAMAVVERLHAKLPPGLVDPDLTTRAVEYVDGSGYLLLAYSDERCAGHREVWRRHLAEEHS